MLYPINDLKRRNLHSDLLFRTSNYLIKTAKSLIIKQNKEKQTTQVLQVVLRLWQRDASSCIYYDFSWVFLIKLAGKWRSISKRYSELPYMYIDHILLFTCRYQCTSKPNPPSPTAANILKKFTTSHCYSFL